MPSNLMTLIHAEPESNRPAIVGERYAKALLAGESALAISPTPAEAEAVTAATRAALKRRGFLQAERAVVCLVDLHLTAAEKADITSYHPGDIVRFLRSGVGFRAGERLQITSIHDGEVRAKREEGNAVRLPLPDAARFTVYQCISVSLAAGDLVRLTRDVKTMAGHRLTNGTRYRVCRIGTDGIRLDNGETLPLACGHWAYGYVSTTHNAPSAAVDRVLISQQASSLPVSSAEHFYALCRRARRGVDIYTDDPLNPAVPTNRYSIEESMT